MPVHVLQRTQLVSASLVGAWAFFSDPRNLQRITPASLDFKILSDLPDRMYAGMMIRYRVRPLLGIPVTWVTEITHVEEGRRFVDEQRVGPYRMWHHEHEFRDVGGGKVEIRDQVTYQLPFSWLAEPMHGVLVQPRLDEIFAFRTQAVNEIFPGKGG
jgi:ligand-binding SRPBCC domain-containing protein